MRFLMQSYNLTRNEYAYVSSGRKELSLLQTNGRKYARVLSEICKIVRLLWKWLRSAADGLTKEKTSVVRSQVSTWKTTRAGALVGRDVITLLLITFIIGSKVITEIQARKGVMIRNGARVT